MPESGVVAPPGLERADSGSFKASAPVFKPGAAEFEVPNSPPDFVSTSPSTPADGDLVDKTTWQYMYNQLLLQYNTEVPFLRHQVVELTGKMAELDRWKMQTMGLVRDLRDQHRALRRKIGDDPPAPTQTPPTAFLEQKPTEVHASPREAEASTVRPSPPTALPPQPPGKDLPSAHAGPAAPREFDAETGLMIYETKVDGVDTMRAEWKVNHFSTKLRGAMGRPVVSAPFDFWGMEEMRMMITPEQQESNTGPRSRKEKEQFSKMVTDGPLKACLTLKVPNSRPVRLRYQMRVGDKVSVFFDCDFSNTAIDNRGVFEHADGLSVNWLSETKDSSIIVGVEMQRPPVENADVDMLKDNKDEEMLPPKDDHPGAPPGLGPSAEELMDTSGV